MLPQLAHAQDKAKALKLLQTVPKGETREVGDAFGFSYREAGHLLGAGSADVRVREDGREWRVLFSGDLGRFDPVLAKAPDTAADADYVVMESTYGNRRHPYVSVTDQLAGVIERTFARGGVLLIPAFAVGRAQQMIWMMDELVTSGRLRPFPIHLDSPMAVDATRIYAAHPEGHQENVANLSAAGASCTAAGTLGRALVEGAREVRIHKRKLPVLADVRVLKGLSGHADADELMRWLEGTTRPPTAVFVTHGEEDAALALADRIARERGFRTHVPEPGESWRLGGER